MQNLFWIFLIGLTVVSALATALEFKAGSRAASAQSWHTNSSTINRSKEVSCINNSGLCVSDSGASQFGNPMVQTKFGPRVVFKDFGAVSLFRPNEKSRFHDMNGKQTGIFAWSQ